MNNLSWFLYLADVVDKLGVIAWLFFAASSLLTVFVSGGRIIAANESAEYKVENTFKTATSTVVWVLPVVMAVSLSVAVLTPSKQTMYAMAASEVAEEALETPVAKKAVDALERYLDKVATKPSAD